MGGAGVSQIIGILASPIIAQIFSPSDYGAFSAFIAVTAIFSIIIAGTYEQVIVLAQRVKWAVNLVALSILLNISFSLLLTLIVAAAITIENLIIIDYEFPKIYIYAPVVILFTGLNAILIQWFLREKKYILISVGRLVQSLFVAIFQVGMGIFIANPIILTLGYAGGIILSATLMSCMFWRQIKPKIRLISLKSMRFVAIRYSNYPKYMILGQFANVLSSSLPIILIGLYYGAEIVGFYALAYKVLAAPATLIINAFGEVYKTESAAIYHQYGNCKSLFIKISQRLAIYSLIPTLIFFIYGKPIFSLIFGPDWEQAGEITSVLAVLFYFQSVSTPLATTVLLANMQKFDMWWQITRVILCSLALVGGYYYFENYSVSIILYVIILSTLYLIHFAMQAIVSFGYYSDPIKYQNN